MKNKKIFISVMMILLSFTLISININGADPTYEWSIQSLVNGNPYSILEVDRPIDENIVSIELVNYSFAYYDYDNSVSSMVRLYDGLIAVAEFTLTEFQAYTNMLSLQIWGVYTFDIQQIYDDGYFIGSYVPDDVDGIRISLVSEPDISYSYAESNIPFLQDDTVVLFGNAVVMLYFRNYDNTLLYNTYLAEFLPEYVPDQTDYPQAPNQYVRWRFDGWKYSNGVTVDETIPVDTSYNVNGFLTVYAKYTLINALTGEIEYEYSPDVDGRVPTLFNTVGVDTSTGFVLVYLISIIVAVVMSLKFNLGNSATLVILIVITGLFNYFGFLPLLISILIYLALAVLLMYTNKGGGN